LALRAQVAPAIVAADSAYNARKYPLALERYEAALTAAPANLSVRLKAGYAAFNGGDLARARGHFRAIIDAAPASGAPYAKAGLALVNAREGKTGPALDMIDSAVAAGYANYTVLDEEQALDPVRTDPRLVAARSRAYASAHPCAGDSAARAFDFWVGSWDVFVNGTSVQAGVNTIESVAGGCAILENWSTVTGHLAGPPSSGKSLNFVDPATGKWKQVWMGSFKGQNNYENGTFSDGAMRFTYSRQNPQGQPVTGRFTFHHLGPNRVRQLQESSTDGGATYSVVYDFIYIRQGSGERP
jgi:hypothetical protein